MAEMKGSERLLKGGTTSADWICDSCVHGPPSSFDGKPCALCNPDDPMLNCYQKRAEPITTNADRLRAMSDEELAEMFCRAETDGRAYGPNGKAYWLDWLQSPAGEVEE